MSRVRRWSVQKRERITDCRVFAVERTIVRSPKDGAEHDFYRILSNDWVQVVPVTEAGDVVMIRQYRQGAERTTLEIPGGIVDPGETPWAAAARELLEETGYAAERLAPLGDVNPNPALFSNRLHGFVAEGAARVGEIRNDGTEETVVELVPLRELPRLLVEGAVDHALVVATLWRFLHESRPNGRLR